MRAYACGFFVVACCILLIPYLHIKDACYVGNGETFVTCQLQHLQKVQAHGVLEPRWWGVTVPTCYMVVV